MKKNIIKPIKVLYLLLQEIDARFRVYLFKYLYPYILKMHLKQNEDPKSIPVYVISYNRLKYVKQTIMWLEKHGHKNIVIIDNNSSYKPLLDYFEQVEHKVYRLKKNWGHEVFIRNPRFFMKRNFHFFAMTDPDVCPIDNCPDNYMDRFFSFLNGKEMLTKVGFSLKIDDLPDTYSLKDRVITWERHFYEKGYYVDGLQLFSADIDTTFALYRPKLFWAFKNRYCAIRVGYPYQLRHLPWYNVDRDNEDKYYCETTRPDITTWNGNISEKDLEKRTTRY